MVSEVVKDILNYIIRLLLKLAMMPGYNCTMRTKTEIQLLQIRQEIKSKIDSIRLLDVISLTLFKYLYIQYKICDHMLEHYRELCKEKKLRA